MRATPTLLIALAALSHPCATSMRASDKTRDGSSEARAIVVPVDYAHYHEWERDYLEKHFPAHFAFGQPVSEAGEDHALIAHEKEDRYYDCYSFRMRGKQYKVYFDIRSSFTNSIDSATRPNQAMDRTADCRTIRFGDDFHSSSSSTLDPVRRRLSWSS